MTSRRVVITVGSASKTFWGGLRTGWIRATPPWIERFARALDRTPLRAEGE